MSFPSPTAVYTLADLPQFRDGHTTWLAVLGHPIAHSLSPLMHEAALAAMAQEDRVYSDWHYVRFDVAPENLPSALPQFFAAGFLGLNLTVPHKIVAVPHVARIDPEAQLTGAVNTLRRGSSGWLGFNTDGYGLTAALRQDLGATLAGADVILLGAGGAARGAAVACLREGCRSLSIANRTRENLDALLALLRPIAGSAILLGFDPAQPPADIPAGTWVVNATSLGLHEGDPAPIDLMRLPKPAGVYDMVYRPRTALLLDAQKLGIRATNGLSMLVHQGARALEIWTGRSVPVTAMENAVKNAR